MEHKFYCLDIQSVTKVDSKLLKVKLSEMAKILYFTRDDLKKK